MAVDNVYSDQLPDADDVDPEDSFMMTKPDSPRQVRRVLASKIVAFLGNVVAPETNRATLAENVLTASINTEKNRAQAAESTLATNLASEQSRAQNAEATLSNSITSGLSTELTRAQAAENALGTSVATEQSRAQAAEATLTTNLAGEQSRAQAAEATKLTTSNNLSEIAAAGATAKAAARSNLGVVIGTDVQAYSAKTAALAALTWAADTLAYFTSASAAATTSITSFGRLLIGQSLTPAADQLAYWTSATIAGLTSLTSFGRNVIGQSLTPAADKMLYWTSATAAALTDLTSFGRTLIGQNLTPAANKITYWTSATVAALADLSTLGRSIIAAADLATLMGIIGSGTRDGTKFLRDDGTWVVPSGSGGSSSKTPLADFIQGTPVGGDVLLLIKAEVAFTLAVGLSGSQFTADTAPAASVTLTILKNGVSVGTLVWGAGNTTPTVNFSTATTYAIGDIFKVTMQATADGNFANVYLCFVRT